MKVKTPFNVGQRYCYQQSKSNTLKQVGKQFNFKHF